MLIANARYLRTKFPDKSGMSDHNEPVPGKTARPKLNIGFMALEPRCAEEVNFLSPDRGFNLAHRDLVILSSHR